MKKIIIFVVVICAIWASSKIINDHLSKNLVLNSKIAAFTDRIRSAANLNTAHPVAKQQAALSLEDIKAMVKNLPVQKKAPLPEAVKVYLKHGGIIEGKLLERSENEFIVEWKGGKTVISAGQVKRVEYKTERDVEWQYKNDVVVKKISGIILDGKIVGVNSRALTLLFTDGGGELEMDVPRQEIDCLLFAPVLNSQTAEIESRLRAQFPKLKVYKEGNVTIFSDSYITTVKQYKKALRNEYTEIYFKFFDLFKERKALFQNFVVIFDDFNDYAEYALTDGVPFWLAVGYFKPTDKTLYLFNAFGDRMEKMVFEVIVGKTGRSIDEVIKIIKKQVDERYHEFIDAKVKELTDRYWDTYSLYRSELLGMTFSTLRHEFAHSVFHNWGLQNIILSKPDIDRKEIADRKKEFLEATDWRKKEELLMKLMRLTRDEMEGVDLQAAESWLAEGIATYCATEPVGMVDPSWLFLYQEMAKKNEINPIEFLTSFKMGSFPGLASHATLNSYAQSWAFTTFLMDKYPEGFMDYQKKASSKDVGKKEEIALLLESLNKDLPVLEREFREYMSAYQPVEDPYVERFMRYHEIWKELLETRN